MQTIPTKQLKNGFSLPVYGLGTWGMGGHHHRDPENDDAADIAAIQLAIEHGVTHLDTAESYAEGKAEELIGQAIRGHDRASLQIVSKAHYDHLGYYDLLTAAKQSLERLGTDYLDLYLLHRFNPNIPIEDTMRALDELMNEGLVRAIGVSNFTVERFRLAQSATSHKIVTNQLHLNLKYREAELLGLLKYCQDNDVLFTAWRPLQKGMLLDNPPDVLKQMMDKYGKTAAQIALNWLISQDHVVTLAKTSTREHLKENLGAFGWTMETQDIELLRQRYPDQESVSDAVPLNYL